MGRRMMLALQREPENRYDKMAVKVVAPIDVPAEVREEVTRDHHPQQKVKEILGQVGPNLKLTVHIYFQIFYFNQY